MKTIILAATIAVALVGCAHRPTTVAASLSAGQLAGHYWASEGDSCTMELRMQQDGSYSAIWHGCLGTYGTAAGRWRVEEQAVVFMPTEEIDMMRDYLRRLSVRRVGSEVVMVRPRWEQLFAGHELSLGVCYRKREAK